MPFAATATMQYPPMHQEHDTLQKSILYADSGDGSIEIITAQQPVNYKGKIKTI